MTQKRKSDFNDNKKSRKRRKISFPEPTAQQEEQQITEELDFSTTISYLPDELLLLIFSYLNVPELHSIVIPVCRKWAQVASTSCLWHTVKVGPDVPTETVIKWLETAGYKLKTLKIKRRNDAEEILKKV